MKRRRALRAAGALAVMAAQSPLPLSSPLQAQGRRKPGFYEGGGSKERAVRFTSRDATLAGTLLLPLISELQAVPGVVLIAGSGPTDRDGNNTLVPERIDLLKQIAELLAKNGIASLRYDKRGIGQSTLRPRTSLAAEEAFFAWDYFVADVEAAHTELLRHGEIKPYATALLGHSEGGLLALAAGTSLELDLLFPPYAGPFLQKLFSFDPARAVAELPTACLLLQGGADRQVVPMADVQPLIDAMRIRGRPGEAIVFPQVSHNLKLVHDPVDPGFGGPLAPAVAETLVKWLVPVLGA
ncbi:MAG: alpha/beta hydrolase [Alphaproteobacteria bacterium]|nr:alpha/beta hydrolase [Alphaproteobacteria bacterium]